MTRNILSILLILSSLGLLHSQYQTRQLRALLAEAVEPQCERCFKEDEHRADELGKHTFSMASYRNGCTKCIDIHERYLAALANL